MDSLETRSPKNLVEKALNKSQSILTSNNEKGDLKSSFIEEYVKNKKGKLTTVKEMGQEPIQAATKPDIYQFNTSEKQMSPAPNGNRSGLTTNGRSFKYVSYARKPLHPETRLMGTVSPKTNVHENIEPEKEDPSHSSSTELLPENLDGKEVGEKYAVCGNCGIISKNFTYCESCQKLLPKNVKTYYKSPDSEPSLKKNTSSFYGNHSTKSLCLSRNYTRRKPPATRSQKKVEPECFTLSSDEEGQEEKQSNCESSLPAKREFTVITENKSACTPTRTYEITIRKKPPFLNGNGENFVAIELQCRSIRIGSLKVTEHTIVTVTLQGIEFEVHTVNSKTERVKLTIVPDDIVQAMCHFGRQVPVLFIYTTPGYGGSVRNHLHMLPRSGPYFDPSSSEEPHKRITLLPESISSEERMGLRYIFWELGKRNKNPDILFEIEKRTANDILVKSLSPEMVPLIQPLILPLILPEYGMCKERPSKKSPSKQSVSKADKVMMGFQAGSHFPSVIKTVKLMTYPPPPQTGGITITSIDYTCLEEGEFLNDVIIDFYLKYLFQNVLSERDRRRTHIFSSFFYRRLTQKPTKRYASLTDDMHLSTAEIRHNRVKTWTRHVDIFEKDFIIIPINESAHWFLAIVCFPYLDGPVQFRKTSKTKEEQPIADTSIDNTSKIADENSQSESFDMCEDSGDMVTKLAEESMDVNMAEPEETDVPVEEESVDKLSSVDQGPIVQPCILMFDSLAGPTRNRIMLTLKDYLKIEWQVRKKTVRTISIKSSTVKVPQQTNYSDCGIYVLQYVESFFETPIVDYNVPIRGLENWFTEARAMQKRSELKSLIKRLMFDQNGQDLLKEAGYCDNEKVSEDAVCISTQTESVGS